MGKEINAILGAQTILIWTYGLMLYVPVNSYGHDRHVGMVSSHNHIFFPGQAWLSS